jgi:hypothetical protein
MTQTFVAGLRCDKLTAPFVVNAPMNRRIFETYVEKELAPALHKGDIVIMDNLAAQRARPPRRPSGPEAPGFFSCRLTVLTLIRSRWPSQTSKPICVQKPSGPSMPSGRKSGAICDLFEPAECQNYFAAAGYGFN